MTTMMSVRAYQMAHKICNSNQHGEHLAAQTYMQLALPKLRNELEMHSTEQSLLHEQSHMHKVGSPWRRP